MFGAVEQLLSLRYLRSRRQESFISVIGGFSLLGIMLGVATLIIVMAVMNGFRAELLGRILGVNGHITVYSNSEGIENYATLREQILQIGGVKEVTPQIQAQVIVTAGSQARGAVVRAMTAQDLERRGVLNGKIVAGTTAGFAAGLEAIIGQRLAQHLRVIPGGEITLLSPKGNQTAMGTVPRIKSYPVSGLFDIGMYEYDSSFVYMPLNLAQTYFRLPNQVNAIEVQVEDPDQVWLIRAEINNLLGAGYRTVDWQQANASFFNAVQVERNVMFLILSLIIIVAAFNIVSGQYMLVKGKGRDIAILRTMGASRGTILRVFFMSGAAIGVIGTLLGVLLGILVTENIEVIQGWVESLSGQNVFNPEIYFLTKLPAKRDAMEVLEVVILSLGISVLAPLWPAWKAAKLDPVEALRYE